MEPHKFDNRKDQKKRSTKSERQLAKELGGRPQPASGAIAGFKGDVVLDDFLIDLKETDAGSFRLTLADLMKITQEADGMAKTPMMVIQFNKAKIIDKKWAVVPIDMLQGD